MRAIHEKLWIQTEVGGVARESGVPLSVAPFTWSQGQVVSVIRGYLEALHLRRRNGNEKSAAMPEKNVRDHPVDKPKSFT